MKWLDIPPVWLLGCLALTWAVPLRAPVGTWTLYIGTGLIVVGCFLILSALGEFWRKKTTPIPHREADALITTGIFRFSRNPIYLADLLLLAGFALRWEAPLGLLLVPVLRYVLEKRFIEDEEERLLVSFGMQFKQFQAKTRRWF